MDEHRREAEREAVETSSAQQQLEVPAGILASGIRREPSSINLLLTWSRDSEIGEKFYSDSLTGADSLNVHVPTAQRRFIGPTLSPTCDSGSGNGSSISGWNDQRPPITYVFENWPPVFQLVTGCGEIFLLGAEDLIPVPKICTMR